MAKSTKKLAIIDGMSVFYRGYYAMSNLSTKDGTPTGGVFGFASMALEVLKKLDPDYVCVAWDKPKTSTRRRKELYPEYKAGRKTPPDDFYAQIPLLHELLQAFGWPLYEMDDYEADDIMGTLAKKASKEDIDVQLVTSDLDMLQLVDKHIHVYALKKGLSNIELFRIESFIMKYGIKPEQFLDLKALMGDSSDNIPGVPGVGKKTATQLLSEFTTLEGVYENLGLIKDSVRRKLEAGKDSAYLSKKVAAIWTDAPIELDLESLDVANCDADAVKHALQKLEFRSLVRRLPEVMQIETDKMTNNGLKKRTLKQLSSPKELESFEAQNSYYVLAEYTDASKKTVQSLSISSDSHDGFFITGEQLADKAYQEAFANNTSVFYDNVCVSYDLKSLIKHFWRWGVNVHDHAMFDVHIASFLLNSLRPHENLNQIVAEHLNIELSLSDGDEQSRKEYEMAALIALHQSMTAALKKPENKKLHKLFRDVEMPIICTLAAMEEEGIKLDTDYLKNMSEELEDQISDVEQAIYGHADQEFNIGSPSQLSKVLFEDMQLSTEGIKKGKTTYSTAASELAKLRGQHPIIDLITQYREYTKLKNTYVDTLPEMIDDKSRLHTTFNLTIAQTGRLSSTDPNLQNIPVRTELGKRIRTAFIADTGKVLVSADYSQFELRLAACLAEDQEMIDMFNRDVDIHTATAAQVYGRDPQDVTKNMRRDAKVVNFGIIYGMSPHGLSAATGMTYAAAKSFIDKYFELRKPILNYMNKLKQQAKEDGYVETLFGRRRPMPDIHSSNFAVRSAAERAAINMPIQGTEADLMKMAMLAVEEKLEGINDAKQLLQIHDSIMVECSESDSKQVAKILKETMESIYTLPVKLTVETVIGRNWGEL